MSGHRGILVICRQKLNLALVALCLGLLFGSAVVLQVRTIIALFNMSLIWL